MPEPCNYEERNHWLASFPEMNPNPVIELDKQGIITFANTATLITLEKLGLPQNPAIFVPEDISEILKLLKDSSEKQVYREINLKTEWFSENIALNQELQVVRIYTSDITNRKRAEEALRESEERYRDLVENANSIIIKMDKTGKISFINTYAQKFFGYSPDEILGQNVKIIIPRTESGSGRSLEEMTNAILGNPDEFSENENENVRKNGDRVWISWRNRAIRDSLGNLIGNLAIGQDITQRKQAEEALRKSEQRFRLALKNAPVSIAIQDVDLIFRWAYNQRTVNPEDIIGKTDTDIFTPDDATRLIELKRKVIETGKEAHEQIWLTMNGKRVYLDLYLEPLRNNAGQITGIGIATVDQTLEKLTEIALRDNEKRLREA